MLTASEINQLIVAFKKVFPTREEVILKTDFDGVLDNALDGIRTTLRQHTTWIEKCVTSIDKMQKELSMANYRLYEHDRWITKAAEKIKVAYKH